MIKMRQAEGITIAKKKGVYSKERCKKLSLSQIEEFKVDVKNKVRVCEIFLSLYQNQILSAVLVAQILKCVAVKKTKNASINRLIFYIKFLI